MSSRPECGFNGLFDVVRDKAIGNGHQAGENFSETRKLFPGKSIKKFKNIRNNNWYRTTAECLLSNTGYHEHTRPVLHTLHGLHTEFQINVKVSVLIWAQDI
ncbi:unnamed protein product [Eretmochelys imbricata]